MKASFIIVFFVAFGLTAQGQIQELPAGFERVSECAATKVKSQDRTGTCWSFSTSSFLESEVLRIHGRTVDISEMFTVRNIYMEKAVKYLRYHGTCNFSEGSLAHDVYRAYDAYGMMPESAYFGKKNAGYHDHSSLVKTLKAYLDSTLKLGIIPDNGREGFTVLLDNHMGPVPETFTYEGEVYTPKTFAAQVLHLNMEDYFGFTSLTLDEYYDDMVVPVPDNFSDGEYYNVPLGELMEIMNYALDNGYSIEWDGDVSEKGFLRRKGYAVLTSDSAALAQMPETLPQEDEVNQEIRQALFDNHQTTDDHLMHVTGRVKSADGRDFYVVKNSWSSRAGIEGYVLMSAAYMAIKTVSIYVHKDAIPKTIFKKLDD